MAIDVLKGGVKPHRFHHDIESLFYVLLWICQTQGGPNNTPRPGNFKGLPIYDWRGLTESCLATTASIAALKRETMVQLQQFRLKIIENLPNYFKPLTKLLYDLRAIIFSIDDRLPAWDTTDADNKKFDEDMIKEEAVKKVDDAYKIIALLDNWLEETEDERLIPGNAPPSKSKVGPKPQAGFVKDSIPDLMRPCDLTNIESIAPFKPEDKVPTTLEQVQVVDDTKNALPGSWSGKRSQGQRRTASSGTTFSVSKRTRLEKRDQQAGFSR